MSGFDSILANRLLSDRRLISHLLLISVLAGLCQGCNRDKHRAGEVSLDSSTKASSEIPIKDIADDSSDLHNLSDGEPSISVNPTNPLDIAILAFSGEWGTRSNNGEIRAPVWRSHDGGETWRKLTMIPPPSAFFPMGPQGPSVNLEGPTDQHLAFESNGSLVVTVMGSYSSTINENYTYRQTAVDSAMAQVGTAFGHSVADQPNIATAMDPVSCSDKVFSAWMRTDFDQAMETSSSVGGAPNSEVGVGDNTNFPNRSARIAAAKDGRAYLLYKTIEGALGTESHKTHFRVKASDNCGTTWNALPGINGVSVHGTDPVETIYTADFGHLLKKGLQVQARARSSDAWIATDPGTSEVYATYVAKDQTGFLRVKVAHSTDHGMTWNDSAVTTERYDCAYPEIAVAENGTVGIMYIGAEEHPDSTVFKHRLARSFDHGHTWTTKTLQSMNPSTLQELVERPFENSNEILWGDYEGLTARGNTFYGVFTGASIGRKISQLDPIFFKATALKSLDDSAVGVQ